MTVTKMKSGNIINPDDHAWHRLAASRQSQCGCTRGPTEQPSLTSSTGLIREAPSLGLGRESFLFSLWLTVPFVRLEPRRSRGRWADGGLQIKLLRKVCGKIWIHIYIYIYWTLKYTILGILMNETETRYKYLFCFHKDHFENPTLDTTSLYSIELI